MDELVPPEVGPVRVGVVGFSRRSFDQEAARRHLRAVLERLVARAGAARVEVVSGLTNQGVPRLAYELAAELGLRTVGVSARRALRVRAGLWPVDERVIVGTDFGDESRAFVDRIDLLVRIGGGPQSRAEVELFRQKLRGDAAGRLVEREVDWLGA